MGHRRRRLERHPLQVRHKQDWGQGFILLLSQAAVLPGSDAGSDEPALSFVIHNRQTSCSMWCLLYEAAIRTWSAVCSQAPHSRFGEGARLYLCMDKWNRPTPVLKRLSLPKLLGTSPSQQVWHRSWTQKHVVRKNFTVYTSLSIYDFFTQKRRCQVRQGCLKDFAQLVQMGSRC